MAELGCHCLGCVGKWYQAGHVMTIYILRNNQYRLIHLTTNLYYVIRGSIGCGPGKDLDLIIASPNTTTTIKNYRSAIAAQHISHDRADADYLYPEGQAVRHYPHGLSECPFDPTIKLYALVLVPKSLMGLGCHEEDIAS